MRLAAIPVDHLFAEMTAFPLASESAFALGVRELDPKLGGASRGLWRAAEQELIRASPSVSLDEIIALRDQLWFQDGESGQRVPLHKYLRRIAHRKLEVVGAMAAPVLPPDRSGPGESMSRAARGRQAWRWLSFALPPDLLVAGLWTGTARPLRVNLLAPQLSQRLADHGFAEPHLHVGAGLDFPLLWISALRRLADPELRPDGFKSPGAAFGEGRLLVPWLLRAAVARYLLAAYLCQRAAREPSRDGFVGFLRTSARTQVLLAMGVTGAAIVDIALRELGAGQFVSRGPSFDDLRVCYAILTGVSAIPFAKAKDDVAWMDPIAGLFAPDGSAGLSSEVAFVAAGLNHLDYLESVASSDPAFAQLFWQVVRMRALYYRHLVQRPMTPGLPWFVRTYGRISPGRKPLSTTTQVESAAQLCGFGRGLRSLEVRTSPEPLSPLLSLLREADGAFHALRASKSGSPGPARGGGPGGALTEFGFVLHLPRVRGGDFDKGFPRANWAGTHADPKMEQNSKGYRYGQFFGLKRVEVLGLARVLLSFPRSLELVRGIDLCTDEMSVPTWVVAPFFRYLREVGNSVSSWLARSERPVPPLRATVHAGEDFVHLLGGLRGLSEAIEFLGLREGDRIGHGVALGVDASRWAYGAGRIPVPRERRLFDLTWEWTRYTRHGVRFEPARMALIEDEIGRLSEAVFGEELKARPREMAELVEDLHTERRLRWTGFPDGNPPDGGKPGRWPRLLRYLSCRAVFRQGQQTEWVTSNEGERVALENLQAHLRERVAALGLVLEINPSSNLLIANLGDLRHHPLWRLRSPFAEDGRPRLRVCIGSDDPLTFNTSLPEEYMLLHDTLVLAGVNPDDADLWLDRARHTGLDARFTLPRREGGDWVKCLGPRLDHTVAPLLFG